MHSHKINFPHHYSLQAILASAFKAALLLHCTFGYSHKIGAWKIEFRTLQGSCSGAGAAKSQILDNDHNRVFTAFIFMKADLLFSYHAEKNCAISQMSNHNFLKKIPAGMRVKTQGFAEAPNMFSAQQWTTPKSFSDSAL